MANASIGFWMAVLVSAGILGQWPMGRLADKFGRLLVLRVQVFVVILGSIAMLTQAAMAPALFILGAAGFTLYPVAMAWACEKSRTPPACGNEPGAVVKLYGREPVGAVFCCDVNAELFR
ncbi:transport protein [Salmonella enterica subsp. enterica]|uniref:Transport protein n=1 Tax=Salmonella enterica I TaxID=59201 RepID=A0A447MV12_SALET|nr:transport protein [Salmonella enterica subsp. enterica]